MKENDASNSIVDEKHATTSVMFLSTAILNSAKEHFPIVLQMGYTIAANCNRS